MRFGTPRKPSPVAEHVEAVLVLRGQADAKPDIEKEKARKRLEGLEARARLVADYQGADEAVHPRRRAGD